MRVSKLKGDQGRFGIVPLLLIIFVTGVSACGDSATGSLPDPGDTYSATARPAYNFVTVRSAPYTTGYYSGFYLYGDRMAIECSVEGEPIIRNDLNSTTWYLLDDGLYVTSIYVDLDNMWEIEPCPDGAPAPPTDLPETAIGDAFFTPAGGDLPLHVEPDSASEMVRTLPYLARVTLLCHEYGAVETGINNESELWYQAEGGGWVFDGYIQTGTIDPVVAEC